MNDIKITDICPLVEKVLREHCHHDHHCPHHSWSNEDGRCVLSNCYKQSAFGREYDERDLQMFERADYFKKLFDTIAAECNGECSMKYGDDGKVEFTFRPMMVHDASECGCEEKTRKMQGKDADSLGSTPNEILIMQLLKKAGYICNSDYDGLRMSLLGRVPAGSLIFANYDVWGDDVEDLEVKIQTNIHTEEDANIIKDYIITGLAEHGIRATGQVLTMPEPHNPNNLLIEIVITFDDTHKMQGKDAVDYINLAKEAMKSTGLVEGTNYRIYGRNMNGQSIPNDHIMFVNYNTSDYKTGPVIMPANAQKKVFYDTSAAEKVVGIIDTKIKEAIVGQRKFTASPEPGEQVIQVCQKSVPDDNTDGCDLIQIVVGPKAKEYC